MNKGIIILILINILFISCYQPSKEEIKKVTEIKEEKLRIQDSIYKN